MTHAKALEGLLITIGCMVGGVVLCFLGACLYLYYMSYIWANEYQRMHEAPRLFPNVSQAEQARRIDEMTELFGHLPIEEQEEKMLERYNEHDNLHPIATSPGNVMQ